MHWYCPSDDSVCSFPKLISGRNDGADLPVGTTGIYGRPVPNVVTSKTSPTTIRCIKADIRPSVEAGVTANAMLLVEAS
jgi:hypothetical protein